MEQERVLHIQAAPSRFLDGQSLQQCHVTDSRVEETCVGYSKDRYDPDHPDADWGGIVNRTFKKRIFQDHVPTRSRLIPAKGGLLPAIDSTSTPQRRVSSKRIFDKDIKFVSNDADARDTPFRTGVHQMGPGGRHDCSDWKTSAQAERENNRGNIHEDKDAPGKVRSLGQESHRRQLQPLYDTQTNARHGVLPRIPTEPSSRHTPTNRGMSILSGIGQSLASSDAFQSIKRPTPHIQSGFDNPADKSLLVENHHSVLLGYTGQRRDK